NLYKFFLTCGMRSAQNWQLGKCWLFAGIFILLLSSACRKKKDSPPDNTPAPASRIVFGDPEGFAINTATGQALDVNSDGKNDLELSTESVKSGPGPHYAVVVTLKCLHGDIGIRIEQRKDTAFVNTIVSI